MPGLLNPGSTPVDRSWADTVQLGSQKLVWIGVGPMAPGEMLPNESTGTPKALNVLSEDVMAGGKFGDELEN